MAERVGWQGAEVKGQKRGVDAEFVPGKTAGVKDSYVIWRGVS